MDIIRDTRDLESLWIQFGLVRLKPRARRVALRNALEGNFTANATFRPDRLAGVVLLGCAVPLVLIPGTLCTGRTSSGCHRAPTVCMYTSFVRSFCVFWKRVSSGFDVRSPCGRDSDRVARQQALSEALATSSAGRNW